MNKKIDVEKRLIQVIFLYKICNAKKMKEIGLMKKVSC